MITARSARTILLAAGLTAGVALVGCTGQGRYTGEHSSAARQRLEAVKAKTEYDMAKQAFLAGNLERAQDGVDRAIRMAAQVAELHVLAARIQLERGDIGAALTSLETAIEIDPEDAEARYFTGVVQERLRDPGQALLAFQAAMAIDPQDPQYATAVGELLIDLGRFDLARGELAGHAAADRSPGIQQLLGHLALLEQRPVDAVEHFEEARLLSPNDQTLVEELVRAQVAAERFGDANQNLEILFQNDSNRVRRDLNQMHALCLFELGRYAEAQRTWSTLSRSREFAGDADVWAGLARAAFASGDNFTAGRAAETLSRVSPTRPEAPVVRALLARERGDFVKASEIMRESEGVVVPDAEWYATLGITQVDAGQIERARETLRKAVEVDPDYAPAKRLMEALVTTYVNVPVGP